MTTWLQPFNSSNSKHLISFCQITLTNVHKCSHTHWTSLWTSVDMSIAVPNVFNWNLWKLCHPKQFKLTNWRNNGNACFSLTLHVHWVCTKADILACQWNKNKTSVLSWIKKPRKNDCSILRCKEHFECCLSPCHHWPTFLAHNSSDNDTKQICCCHLEKFPHWKKKLTQQCVDECTTVCRVLCSLSHLQDDCSWCTKCLNSFQKSMFQTPP